MRLEDVSGYLKRADQISIVIGAGASRTAGIPTAPLLVQRINEEFSHCLVDLTEAERLDYGRTMGALAPGDRKSLIQPLLDASEVNWGHIALACIIRNINVRRVLTFNFDLILERAASLIGMHLPVYDFGVAPTRELSGLAAPAIFHLHGQSYGLRLMNSQEETAAHKEALRPLLADSLRNHLTIVIGYSGEADAAFRMIEEEFNSHQNLIWLGYEAEPKKHLATLLAKTYAFYVGDCDFDRTMIDLAEMIGCWPPEVIKNPPRHILAELSEVARYPVEPEVGLDLLTSSRRRLEIAANEWDGGKDGEAKAQEALISGTVPEAVNPDDTQTKDEKAARAWTKIKTGNNLLRVINTIEASSEKLASIDSAIASFEDALSTQPDLFEAYRGLATALMFRSSIIEEPSSVTFLNKAEEALEHAQRLRQDDPVIYRLWGMSIARRAKYLEGDEARNTYLKARPKFERMLELDGDDAAVLNSYTSYLLDFSRVEIDANLKSELISEAELTVRKIKRLSGGEPNYNFACLLARKGNHIEALAELEACYTAGILPSRATLAEDEDLQDLKDEPKFEWILRKAKG